MIVVRLLRAGLVHTELPDRTGKFDNFVTFCNTNGVDTSAMEIVCKSGADFGLKAKRDLAEDETVLCIPRRMILTAEQLPGDPAFRDFAARDPLLKEMPNLLLVMILIREFCGEGLFLEAVRRHPAGSIRDSTLHGL